MPKNERITVHFPKDILALVDEQVAKKGIGYSRSDYFRDAVEHYLKTRMGLSYLYKKGKR